MGVDMEYCKCCQECVHVEYIVKCENCSEYIEFNGDCICDHCIDDEEVIKDQNNNYFCTSDCYEYHKADEPIRAEEKRQKEEKLQKEKETNIYHCDACNVDIKRSSKSAHFLSKKHRKLGNIA